MDILERAVDHLYPKNNLTVLTDSFKRERVENDMVKNEFDIIQFIERGDFDSFKNFDFADYEKKIDQFCHCEKFSFNQAIQVLLKVILLKEYIMCFFLILTIKNYRSKC